jgi:hypothetical protein
VSIVIRTVPSTDGEFKAEVRSALPRPDHVDGDELVAGGVDDVRAAARKIRELYPSAVFRRQNALASVDPFEVWYAYRDPDVFRDRAAD